MAVVASSSRAGPIAFTFFEARSVHRKRHFERRVIDRFDQMQVESRFSRPPLIFLLAITSQRNQIDVGRLRVPA